MTLNKSYPVSPPASSSVKQEEAFLAEALWRWHETMYGKTFLYEGLCMYKAALLICGHLSVSP